MWQSFHLSLDIWFDTVSYSDDITLPYTHLAAPGWIDYLHSPRVTHGWWLIHLVSVSRDRELTDHVTHCIHAIITFHPFS